MMNCLPVGLLNATDPGLHTVEGVYARTRR